MKKAKAESHSKWGPRLPNIALKHMFFELELGSRGKRAHNGNSDGCLLKQPREWKVHWNAQCLQGRGTVGPFVAKPTWQQSRMTEPIPSISLQFNNKTFMCKLPGNLWGIILWATLALPNNRCTQSSLLVFIELDSDNWKKRALLDVYVPPPTPGFHQLPCLLLSLVNCPDL